MNAAVDFTWLFGIVISLLLSLVVYFVRLLHVDFRKMQEELSQVKTMASLIKSECKGGLELIGLRVGQLEVKIKQLEAFFFNFKHHEKE
ncbi:MAG: hypothetical protein HXX14_09440 [Bacteroidetes bacterium]|nr:hypothetical protein [Bacteroidota bacterium]